MTLIDNDVFIIVVIVGGMLSSSQYSEAVYTIKSTDGNEVVWTQVTDADPATGKPSQYLILSFICSPVLFLLSFSPFLSYVQNSVHVLEVFGDVIFVKVQQIKLT